MAIEEAYKAVESGHGRPFGAVIVRNNVNFPKLEFEICPRQPELIIDDCNVRLKNAKTTTYLV